MKEVTFEKEIRGFETIDGMVFDEAKYDNINDARDKARMWERDLRAVSYAQIKDLVKEIYPGDEDEFWRIPAMAGMNDGDSFSYKIFSPRDQNDIKNFLMYHEISGTFWLKHCQNTVDNMKPGTKYLWIFDEDSDTLNVIFSKDSLKKFFKDRMELFEDMISR